MDKKFAVSLVVNNVPGVMNRIGGIYSKRNYNISSFSGGETEDPRYTRITVVSTGDNRMKQCNTKKWKDIVAIAGGTYHAVGVDSDGKFYFAGDNGHGQRDLGKDD